MKETTSVLTLANHARQQNIHFNIPHHEYNVQQNVQIHKQLNKFIHYKMKNNVYFHVEK